MIEKKRSATAFRGEDFLGQKTPAPFSTSSKMDAVLKHYKAKADPADSTAKFEIFRLLQRYLRGTKLTRPVRTQFAITEKFVSRRHGLKYILIDMGIIKLLMLVMAASFINSCGGTSASSSQPEPKPKPYAVSVIRQFPSSQSACELLFTFTNKLKYEDNLHIGYIAFDAQGNTLKESVVYFDTTFPNRQNQKSQYIFVGSGSGIDPCGAIARLIITTNGHVLEKSEFVFAKRW